MSLINLDVQYFAEKLLNKEERELLDNVNIDLLVDPETRSISHAVSFCNLCDTDTMIRQDLVIHKFMQDLYADKEIQELF
jgi:hypothetical protein